MTVIEQPAHGALGALSNLKLSGRAMRFVNGYILATATVEVARRIYRGTRARFAYTISVPSGDDVYDALHGRILELIPPARRKSVLMRTLRRLEFREVSPGYAASEQPPAVGAFYDSTREQTIVVDGHRVHVTIERDGDNAFTILSDPDKWRPRDERIVFTAIGARARDAVAQFVHDTAASLVKPDRPRFYIARWGSWERRDDLDPRALDTVVLRKGRKEALVADLEAFLGQRADYARLGAPYHRGYLFHGPPGTGKTSLAKALATHLGLNVYYIPLTALSEDTNVLQLVSSVQPGSMLLLEDIDVLAAAQHREEAAAVGERPRHGVSLSGLLNALDGVATPSGLITIMTTNRPDVLDDALIRPGRVDWVEEVDYLTGDQFCALVRAWTGRWWGGAPRVRPQTTAAQVAEVMKRHLGDVDAQLDAVRAEFVA